MKAFEPLPKALEYLQPFVNFLARLPDDQLNEDVDASKLEAVLRSRLKGLGEEAAEDLLENDRQVLWSWLDSFDSGRHPAHWVLGWLSLPELAEKLIAPEELPRRGPEIRLATPTDWDREVYPRQLQLKKGKVVAVITVVDEFTVKLIDIQEERFEGPPHVHITHGTVAINLGPCIGKKHSVRQPGPVTWKKIRYTLRVPGGHVLIDMFAEDGADFDESILESVLPLLELTEE